MTKKPLKSTRVNLSNPQPRLLDHDKFIESKLKKIMKSNFQPIRKKKIYVCMLYCVQRHWTLKLT